MIDYVRLCIKKESKVWFLLFQKIPWRAAYNFQCLIRVLITDCVCDDQDHAPPAARRARWSWPGSPCSPAQKSSAGRGASPLLELSSASPRSAITKNIVRKFKCEIQPQCYVWIGKICWHIYRKRLRILLCTTFWFPPHNCWYCWYEKCINLKSRVFDECLQNSPLHLSSTGPSLQSILIAWKQNPSCIHKHRLRHYGPTHRVHKLKSVLLTAGNHLMICMHWSI